MFHSRFGRKIRKAASPPSQIHLSRNDTALLGQQQAHYDSQAEDGDGILFFHAEAGDHAEPEPIPRIISLDGENGEIGAAHPEVGLQAVCSQQASVGKILRSDDGADGAQEHGVAASAEFAGQNGGLHNKQGRRQRRDETNAAQRVAQHGAADVNQERDERGLIYISPGKAIAASHVIELVAEISVAVIEVTVKQQLGQGDGPDHGHPGGKERLPIGAGRGGRSCGAGHGTIRIADLREFCMNREQASGFRLGLP